MEGAFTHPPEKRRKSELSNRTASTLLSALCRSEKLDLNEAFEKKGRRIYMSVSHLRVYSNVYVIRVQILIDSKANLCLQTWVCKHKLDL